MRRKEKEKMSSTLKIKAPKAPLKGKGNKREPFYFRANHHADALRVAFWDALPDEHKTEVCTGVRAKGYCSFAKFITPEALAVFRKAVEDEARMIGLKVPEPEPTKPAAIPKPVPTPSFANMAEAEAKARAWAELPDDQRHPAPAEIMELKAASGLGWAKFERWAREGAGRSEA